LSRTATATDVPADVLDQLRKGATAVPAAGTNPQGSHR
jgi:hypothetical protein